MFSNGSFDLNTSEKDVTSNINNSESITSNLNNSEPITSNLNNSESITKLSEHFENPEDSTTELICISNNIVEDPVTSPTTDCETLGTENSSSIKSKRTPYR
ncbi:10370_t:CDS:2, partial [Scutellospora calospora]